jgi:integrase
MKDREQPKDPEGRPTPPKSGKGVRAQSSPNRKNQQQRRTKKSKRERWDEIRANHKGDPLRQIDAWWDEVPHEALTGRNRLKATVTCEDHKSRMRTFVADLEALNCRIQNLDEISQKHVRLVVQDMESRGLAAKTMKNRLSGLREFMKDIGRPGVVPLLEELLKDKSRGLAHAVVQQGKSLEAHQIDSEWVFEEARKLGDPVFVNRLMLMHALGARDEEAVQFRPAIAWQNASYVVFSYGTKGKRTRIVEVRTEQQREVLRESLQLAKGNPHGYMGKPTSLKTAMRRWYAQLEKIGMTKKGEFGVTAYALRHSYANHEFEAQSGGVKSPVMGGAPLPREDLIRVKKGVGQALGHSRPDADDHYNGTHRTMSKLQRRRCDHRITEFCQPDIQRVLTELGLVRLCLRGPEADGEPLGNVVLFSFDAPDGRLAADVHKRVTDAISQIIGGRTCVLLHSADPQVRDLPELELFSSLAAN